jgi:hypothetical protein
MSLEESIQALTAAVIANTAALGKAPKATKAKGEPESTQSAASTPTPAATAPAAGQQAQSPAASTVPANPQLLAQATEAVIKLANEHSRDDAVGILAARKVTRCSDLKPDQLQAVLDEALVKIAAAVAAKQAATANASLV